MLGNATPYSPPRTVMQLQCEGIDVRSFGRLEEEAEFEFVSRENEQTWWRISTRDNRIVSALYVGPPNTAQHLTRAIQENADLRPVLDELKKGKLKALSTL